MFSVSPAEHRHVKNKVALARDVCLRAIGNHYGQIILIRLVQTSILLELLWTKTFGFRLTAKLNTGYCRPACHQVKTPQFTVKSNVILISLRLYMCMYLSTEAYMHVFMHQVLYVWMNIHICIYVNIRIYESMYVCMYINVCKLTRIYEKDQKLAVT